MSFAPRRLSSYPRGVRPTLGFGLSFLLAVGSARAQTAVPDARFAAVRDLLAQGHYAEADTAIRTLPPAIRGQEEAAVLRACARVGALAIPIEPDALRSLPAPTQVEVRADRARLDRWLQTHASDTAVLLVDAHLAIVEGALDDAALQLETYTRTRPDDPVGWNDRAMVLVALRRLPEAEASLRTATERAPGDAEPWANLGAVRLARGDGVGAIEAFSRAAETDPSVARYQSDLGSAFLANSDAERAIAAFRRAATTAPTDGVILSNLGYALSLANHLDDAVVALRRAVELAPQHAGAWDNLGAVLSRQGDRAGAGDAFRRALQIDPHDTRARANLDTLDASTAPHR